MSRHLGWDAFAFGLGPRGFFWRGPRRGRRQWFESGDMKYVILKLLQDKPRHGYEVMKELEEQLHGCYSPSPGTVYPTLQWLEDEGLVSAREVEGKKVYEITEAGRKFLDEHRDVVDDIFERVRDTVDRALGGAMVDVNRVVGRLMRAVYRVGWRARDDATRQRLVEILNKTLAEVEGLAS
jgi:DNA-binding PadR family transcriptional regulator